MVLEGVHLVPGLLPREPENSARERVRAADRRRDGARAALLLARGRRPSRPMAKYLDRFDEIRRLQDYIVERAEREGVAGDREREREPRDGRRRRARALGGRARAGARVTDDRDRAQPSATPDAQAPLPVPVVSARDRACGARSARWLGRADQEAAEESAAAGMRIYARPAADQRPRRLRLVRRGGRARAGRDRSAPAAPRSISRSTRSRAAASSRAAATARCR